MGVLDDTAIFIAVIQQGGFSHAARHLGLSNGLISRRIAQLESELGVTLIRRTTRQIQLTPEGELFWLHAQRIKQEMDAAISLIQASAKKPKGTIRISAPLHFGRYYLTPIIMKFMSDFNDIKVDLILSNQKLDPVKSGLDLVLRGAGYLASDPLLTDSSMQMKLLLKQKIRLYASAVYLQKYAAPVIPDDLMHHRTIYYTDIDNLTANARWSCICQGKKIEISLNPTFNVNDIESAVMACVSGFGIGRLTDLNVKSALQLQQLQPVLENVDWGNYHLYALYSQQKALPKRTRLLLEFIDAHTRNLVEK